MREAGQLLELVVNSHRRIRILEPLDETEDEKINGRLLRNNRKTSLKKFDKKKDQKIDEAEILKECEDTERKIIYAKTENVITEPFEKNNEIKARNNICNIVYLK